MADQRSLKQQMNHFLKVYGQNIRKTGEAILDGRWETFDSFVKTASESKLTVSIRDSLTSSSQNRASFERIVGDLFPDEFGARAFLGALAGTVGAIITVNAGAIAGALGLAALGTLGTAAVFLVGIALIVWGLAQLLPRVFEAARDDLVKHLSQLTN